MSNLDFLLTYGLPPLGFLLGGVLVYAMARAGQRHDRRPHPPTK